MCEMADLSKASKNYCMCERGKSGKSMGILVMHEFWTRQLQALGPSDCILLGSCTAFKCLHKGGTKDAVVQNSRQDMVANYYKYEQ